MTVAMRRRDSAPLVSSYSKAEVKTAHILEGIERNQAVIDMEFEVGKVQKHSKISFDSI